MRLARTRPRSRGAGPLLAAAVLAAIGLTSVVRAASPHELFSTGEARDVARGRSETLVIDGAETRVLYDALEEGRDDTLARLERECDGAVERVEQGAAAYVLCARPGSATRVGYVRGDARASLLVTFEARPSEHRGAPDEAAGEDLPGVARPRGSRRTLSVSLPDGGPRAVGYRVPRATREVLEETHAALRAESWRVVHARTDRAHVLRARRGGRHVDVVIAEDEGATSWTAFEAEVARER